MTDRNVETWEHQTSNTKHLFFSFLFFFFFSNLLDGGAHPAKPMPASPPAPSEAAKIQRLKWADADDQLPLKIAHPADNCGTFIHYISQDQPWSDHGMYRIKVSVPSHHPTKLQWSIHQIDEARNILTLNSGRNSEIQLWNGRGKARNGALLASTWLNVTIE